MGGPIKQTICSTLHQTFFTYTTVKLVQVPNTTIAILYRLLQLLIFAYIALYIVWWKKGYQQFQEPRGTSVIKIKGIAKVIGGDTSRYIRADAGHLWDTTEYQLPPLENNAFFLATRQLFTYNQTEDYCPGALSDNSTCIGDIPPSECQEGRPTKNTFGYYTGKCIPSRENESINVCEIYAWCPEEESESTEYMVNSTELEQFTIYLKTMVSFGLFNITLRNVRDDTKLPCIYDSINNTHCPIIRLDHILNSLNTNKTALTSLGGLIEIVQDWTCNFDFKASSCYPTIKFNLLQSGDDAQSPGINYRYAQKFRANDTDYRTLAKVFGLRFVVTITGKGGQFYIVNLFVAIGSGIGFMVIAGIVCDAIFMYIHRARERYRERKFTVCDIDKKRTSSDDHLVRE